MTLTVGSLFSGIGGFDEAFRRAGCRMAWTVEIDPACRRVLARHFPEVRQYGDIREVRGAEVKPVDVLCGGFPCQDLSVAGRHAGLAGARSGLFHEFARLVGELRPTWLLLENVPGLLSSARGKDFATVLRTLDDLGYGLAWRVLDSQHFGVPQRRRRVFIVGRAGEPVPAEVLFESEGGAGDTAPGREAGQGIAHALAASSVSSGYRYDANGEDYVIDGMAWESQTQRITDEHGLCPTLSPGSARVSPFVGYQCQGTNVGEMGTLRGGNGHVTGGVPFTFARQSGGDVRPDIVSNGSGTLQVQQQRAVMSGMSVRRLTPRECERLQAFPDDWTAGEADSVRYRMLGNAVTVNVVEYIARRMVAQEARP